MALVHSGMFAEPIRQQVLRPNQLQTQLQAQPKAQLQAQPKAQLQAQLEPRPKPRPKPRPLPQPTHLQLIQFQPQHLLRLWTHAPLETPRTPARPSPAVNGRRLSEASVSAEPATLLHLRRKFKSASR